MFFMVDQKDFQIIQELQKDGRISLRKIAENLEISPSTSSNRFHKLKEENVIKSFKPVLNLQKLGYELTNITQIKAESGKNEEVYKKLKKLDFARSVYTVTGETDLIIVTKFQNRADMNKGAKKIRNIEGVVESKTNVVLESEEDLPLPLN